ncbi:hypothetical protein DBR32_06845 [Taibaiella sp. KBW10]|uniref:WG repeat-containing protein n=1 Tax=Taibaiella sp. KBW10 TaxID=2153357 RepID=UPI000F59B2BD|nr:WG repeat-containing protein [Taibaiella sp. KBW10]RQO31851.1 hypothetical protein DBR32_06845 [Taibaiella sp. KBW10]
MKYVPLLLLSIILNSAVYAQKRDTWTAFWNQDTTLIGFKDAQGKVKIEPKFMGLTTAGKFDDIMAVTEPVKDTWANYYQTKSGRILGRDSLYVFDNTADCESEGFIRFHDPKTDKVGMFNRKGDIVIPAEYNGLTPVRNGMAIALKGAKKKYWDKDKHDGCNHYSWTGGTEVLIDTNNRVLVADFTYNGQLNFFSLKVTAQPNTDPIRKHFKGLNGQYYSFIDFELEFKQWLQQNLLQQCTKKDLLAATYEKITWEAPDDWRTEPKTAFIDRNVELLQSKFKELSKAGTDYAISRDGLNPFMFAEKEFESYYNNCGEAKDWLYPTMDIIITHNDEDHFSQDHLEFLRTEQGYKLICVTIRKGTIR